mgnify:CR=1 FL=1
MLTPDKPSQSTTNDACRKPTEELLNSHEFSPASRKQRMRQTNHQEQLAEERKTAVIRALVSRNLVDLQALIDGGADLNWRGGGALQVALWQRDSQDLTRFLISRGARTENCFFPQWFRSRDPIYVDFLIHSGVQVNRPDGCCLFLHSLCDYLCADALQPKPDLEAIATSERLIRSLLEAGAHGFNLMAGAARFLTVAPELVPFFQVNARSTVELLIQNNAHVHPRVLELFPGIISETPFESSPDLITNREINAAISQVLGAVRPYNSKLLQEVIEQLPDKYRAVLALTDIEALIDLPLEILSSGNFRLSSYVINSALIHACCFGRLDLIRSLEENFEVDVTAENNLALAEGVSRRRWETFAETGPIAVEKFLIEHGADINQACAHLPDTPNLRQGDPLITYLHLINQVLNSSSGLHFNKLLPLTLQIHNCVQNHAQQRASFRVLSSCAAVVAHLTSMPSSTSERNSTEGVFLSLVSNSFEEMRLSKTSIHHVEPEAAKAFEACEKNLHELTWAFVDAIAIPTLVQRVGVSSVTLSSRDAVERFRSDLFSTTKRWLFSGFSIQQLKKLFDKWERHHRHHPQSVHQEAAWHPLIADTEILPGIRVCAISTYQDLLREGLAMNNCLKRGAYATSFLLGTHHLLAIRKNGESVLNLTVVPSKEQQPNGWRISEFKGKSNSTELSPELYRYLERFRSELSSGNIRASTALFGQTPESLARLACRLSSPIERILGIELGQPPLEAIDFYTKRLAINPGKLCCEEPRRHLPVFFSDNIPPQFEPYLEQLRRG